MKERDIGNKCEQVNSPNGGGDAETGKEKTVERLHENIAKMLSYERLYEIGNTYAVDKPKTQTYERYHADCLVPEHYCSFYTE